jgi:hypothetical protein
MLRRGVKNQKIKKPDLGDQKRRLDFAAMQQDNSTSIGKSMSINELGKESECVLATTSNTLGDSG